MTGLCWLSSYPKSGNTWLRAMLTACLNPDQPVDLEALVGRDPIERIDRLVEESALDPTLLTLEELADFRATLFRREAGAAAGLRFAKTHLMNARTRDGRRLFGSDCGRAVYLVRNPLDVAVSYAHYVDRSYEDIVGAMSLETAVLDRPRAARPILLPQPMSSWPTHVRSWVEDPPLPVIVIRYEDMLTDPVAALSHVAQFCELKLSADAIERAVARTAFQTLKTREAQQGFSEKPMLSKSFFRSGTTGEGRSLLSLPSVAMLTAKCGNLLDRFGYRQ